MRISKAESEVFCLKIGRYSTNLDALDAQKLESDILHAGLDLCRIKVLGSDLKLFEKLDTLNFYYDIYNLNYYNILDFNSLSEFNPIPELSVREVKNPDADEDFKSVLSNLLDSRSWVEYDSFLAKNLLTEERKKIASFDYYSSFSRANDGNSYTGLMYYNETAIGLFMGLFKGDVFFGNLFGLIEEYRGKGLAKYFYGFMNRISKAKGISYFENEVNVFNFKSQKSAISQNFLPKEIYYNITLYPFCNTASSEFKKMDMTTLPSILSYLSISYEGYNISNIKVKKYLELQNYDSSLLLEPVKTKDDIFLVFHLMFDKTIGESYYFHLKPRSK